MTLATEQEIKSHYSGQAIANDYVRDRFVSELQRLLHREQVRAVQTQITRTGPRRILEVAPGPGRLTRCLRFTGALVCLEFNEGMIREGRQACPTSCRWVRGDGFRLPFDQSFDLAYCFRFIRHFHRADRDRLYGELRRVLRPGGILLFDAVNEAESRPLREAHPEEYPVYDELYCEESLRAELSAAGFEIVRLLPVQKRFGLQSWSQNVLGPRVHFLNRWVIGLLEKVPRRTGLEWIVTCRRV